MANKELKTRIILKHDTEANWNKAVNFIPKAGEIIIYDKDNSHTEVRFKLGDGVTNVNSLPFKDDLSKYAKIDENNNFTQIQYFPAEGVNIGSTHLTEAGLQELETQAEKIPTLERKFNGDSAKQAIADKNGNDITATYALKTEIPDVSDFITDTEASNKYQLKGDYLTSSDLAGYTPLTKAGLYNLITKATSTTNPSSYSTYYVPFVSSTSNSYRCTLDNLRTWFRSGLLSSVPSEYITETELSTELSNYIRDSKTGLYNLFTNATATNTPSYYSTYYIPFIGTNAAYVYRATLAQLKSYFTSGISADVDLSDLIYGSSTQSSITTATDDYYVPFASSSASYKITLNNLKTWVLKDATAGISSNSISQIEINSTTGLITITTK